MGAPSQSLTEVSERLSSFHMPRCIVAIVTVLLVHAITAVYVMIDKVEYEEYDYSVSELQTFIEIFVGNKCGTFESNNLGDRSHVAIVPIYFRTLSSEFLMC